MPQRLLDQLLSFIRGDGFRARLVRGGIGTAAVQAGSRVVALGLGIVLARGLRSDGYGIYAYAIAIMNLLTIVAEAGVPTLLMREVAASYARQEWGLLRGVLIRGGQFVFLASTAVSVTGFLVLWVVADGLSHEKLVTFALMLLVLPLSALTNTVAHAMYGLHRVVIGQTMAILLRPLLFLLVVGIFFYFYPSLRTPQHAMGFQAGVFLFVLVTGLLLLLHFLPDELGGVQPKYHSWKWLKGTLPFIMIGGALIVNSQTDIIMLGWYATSADVGIYRVAVQGAGLVTLALHIVNVVVAPEFARLYAQGDLAKLQSLLTIGSRVTFIVALPCSLLFVFWGSTIIGWIFGGEFRPGGQPLAILALGQLVNVFFGPIGYLLNMTGYEQHVSRTLWQASILNIVLNAVLIPLLGVNGAAMATSFTLALVSFRLSLFAKQRLNLHSTAFSFRR